MKHKSIFKIALLAATGIMGYMQPAHAQEARTITLGEAITLGVKNSSQLRMAGAKVEEATAQLREARERRLPDLKISGSYLRLAQPTIDLKINLGGQQPQGGSGEGGTGSTSSVEVNQAVYGMANLSLPLFTGFRIQYGIESAKYLERAAKLDAAHDTASIIENIVEAYSNMYKAKAGLDLVRENLKQSKQRVLDFSNLEKNGLLARNDLLKAQLQQSNVELALLDAENNWKITYINMNLLLGLDENTVLQPDTTVFTKASDIQEFTYWESMALQNRSDIAAMQMRLRAANAGVGAAKGEYYPSLALSGGYVAADIPNFLTITNAVNAGIGLSYSPSSLWKTGSKVQQAKARVQQAEAGLQTLNDAVRLQTAQAYQLYLVSQKKIAVYEQAVAQADENYRIVKNKYDNALANTTDLLEADVAQLQAGINYATAKADALVAFNKLMQAAGLLHADE